MAESASPGPLPGAPSYPHAAQGWVRVTDDDIIMRGPGLLHAVVFTDDGSTIATFFDGENAGGRRMFSVRTIVGAEQTKALSFPKGVPFQRGLFVQSSAAADDIFVLVEPAAYGQ